MGGSSLAPEVICATADVPLLVLDSSDPDQVRTALDRDLGATVVVVSSKSGSTVETASQRKAFEGAFREAGIDPGGHIVVVTDPGSPLEKEARDAGYRVFLADPDVGGRFSALTAFGLVPSVLAGAPVNSLVADARNAAASLATDEAGNPALTLGAALAADPTKDKFLLAPDAELAALPDWIEQLVAESTGKEGRGLLPVIGHPTAPDVSFDDVVPVSLTSGGSAGSSLTAAGSLGAQFVLWEAATAVMGRLLGVNPFDQPDVESAKVEARSALGRSDTGASPVAAIDGIEIYGDEGWLGTPKSLDEAVAALLSALEPNGYLAVMAYLERTDSSPLPAAATSLMRHLDRPVTFGWGPRFLHSTGQLHKGGPRTGAYLQITGEPEHGDVPVPGTDYGFGRLIWAQAQGDAAVLQNRGSRVLRLHLTDRDSGTKTVTALLGRVRR
jgi:glucose-6-phosphate isomerase